MPELRLDERLQLRRQAARARLRRKLLLVAGVAAAALAGVTAAAVAAWRRGFADTRRVGRGPSRTDRPALPRRASGGWATCSAPSARAYDVTFGWLLGGLYRTMADDLAAAVAGIHEPDVLEVGPGPGGLAVELARRAANLRLTGVDVDPAMVDRAALRARREGLDDRLTFMVGDVAELPFPDASFDLVTSSFSVHHWPEAATGFAEIRRVLRPGGRAIVYDLPDRWGRIERKARPLAAVATLGGFAGARSKPFPWPGPVALTNRLEVVREAGCPTPGTVPGSWPPRDARRRRRPFHRCMPDLVRIHTMLGGDALSGIGDVRKSAAVLVQAATVRVLGYGVPATARRRSSPRYAPRPA